MWFGLCCYVCFRHLFGVCLSGVLVFSERQRRACVPWEVEEEAGSASIPIFNIANLRINGEKQGRPISQLDLSGDHRRIMSTGSVLLRRACGFLVFRSDPLHPCLDHLRRHHKSLVAQKAREIGHAFRIWSASKHFSGWEVPESELTATLSLPGFVLKGVITASYMVHRPVLAPELVSALLRWTYDGLLGHNICFTHRLPMHRLFSQIIPAT